MATRGGRVALFTTSLEWRRDLQQKTGDTTASKFLAYPMWFSTRDMARIGYLMLRDGAWNGRQIVPVEWVKKSTSAITPVGQMHPSSTRRGRFGFGMDVAYHNRSRLPAQTETELGARYLSKDELLRLRGADSLPLPRVLSQPLAHALALAR